MHLGHLLLCQEATWQLGLSRVVLVPTGHAAAPARAAESPAMRLRLAQAAAIGNPVLTVSRLEIDRPGPSYMVDTLRELAQRYPGNGLVLLLGADQFAALSTWHEPERSRSSRASRGARGPGVSPDVRGRRRHRVHRDAAGRHLLVDDPRARAPPGRPIRYLVPDAVRELIEAEGLYRDESQNADPSVVR